MSDFVRHTLHFGVMSLRERVTTEAISYLIDIIEIATTPERRLAMTN
jgi:hypothetical protein